MYGIYIYTAYRAHRAYRVQGLGVPNTRVSLQNPAPITLMRVRVFGFGFIQGPSRSGLAGICLLMMLISLGHPHFQTPNTHSKWRSSGTECRVLGNVRAHIFLKLYTDCRRIVSPFVQTHRVWLSPPNFAAVVPLHVPTQYLRSKPKHPTGLAIPHAKLPKKAKMKQI